jgi:excisionase family DNA binding protein
MSLHEYSKDVSPKELAKITQKSVVTIRYHIRIGALPAYKQGGLVRIRLKDAEEYAEGKKITVE